jgi:hypothetical protein
MRPRWGKTRTEGSAVSEQERIEIIAEVPPSKLGTYQRTDEHNRDVRGDASGEWTLDENGEVEDIVFSCRLAQRAAGLSEGRAAEVPSQFSDGRGGRTAQRV